MESENPPVFVFEESGPYFSFKGSLGDREYMEDAAGVYEGAKGMSGPTIFAVFDGHGGTVAAEFCKAKMGEAITSHPKYTTNPKKAIKEAYLLLHDLYAREAKRAISDLSDGTTATTLYVTLDDADSPERQHRIKFYLACVGDSRAVLVKKNGEVEALSRDHNCKNETEIQRVVKAGGEIMYDDESSPRVFSEEVGGLSVTRSIGDVSFKPYVTAEPEIQEGFLDKDSAYIVLASDGLWESIENEEVGTVLINRPVDLDEKVKYLIEVAKQRDNYGTRNDFSGPSCDNITVLAVEVKPLILQMLKYQKKLDQAKEAERLAEEAEKGDTIVFGIPREGYIADILLWRAPLRTGLWFLVGCLFFYLTSFVGYSTMTVASYLLLVQLTVTTFIVKTAPILKRAYLVDDDFDSKAFVNEGTFFSKDTIETATKVAYDVCTSEFERWKQIVHTGSAKRLLIALRNISYFFTPVESETLLFITFVGMFTLIFLYDNNRTSLGKSTKQFWINANLFRRSLVRSLRSRY